jgi:two-component sensor histidine kinase
VAAIQGRERRLFAPLHARKQVDVGVYGGQWHHLGIEFLLIFAPGREKVPVRAGGHPFGSSFASFVALRLPAKSRAGENAIMLPAPTRSGSPMPKDGCADATGAKTHFHPLELIPWFRRFPYTWWRDVIYTFIWNMGFATLFGATQVLYRVPAQDELAQWLWADFVITNCVGFTIHAGFRLTSRLVGARRDGWGFLGRALYYTSLPVAGVLLGNVVGVALLKLDIRSALRVVQHDMVPILVVSLLVSLILTIIFFARERQAAAEAELARERSRGAETEQRALAAHLRMLQAQIEPHFLFNTLANVVSLIDIDAPKAKTMLENFIQYLRTSLTAAREERTTLAREADLLHAYLNVLLIRMGPRLHYRIEIPRDLGPAVVPPMLLQPLVENAIKHGLEPKIEGGEVAVSARRENDGLLIRIADTGLGFNAKAHASVRHDGSGVGLSNLRERLRSQYGERATMTIADHEPAGTEVTLRIPWEPA